MVWWSTIRNLVLTACLWSALLTIYGPGLPVQHLIMCWALMGKDYTHSHPAGICNCVNVLCGCWSGCQVWEAVCYWRNTLVPARLGSRAQTSCGGAKWGETAAFMTPSCIPLWSIGSCTLMASSAPTPTHVHKHTVKGVHVKGWLLFKLGAHSISYRQWGKLLQA